MSSVHALLGVDLFEPLTYQFFRNGLLIATLTGALCGLIGVFVVLRGMSYIGHGLSHAVFGGAALAAVLDVNYFLGAGFWGLASGLMIGRVSRKRIIGADAAIGVITTASFAMGLALQARFGQARRSIDAVLFGNVLGVFTADIVAVAVVGLISALVVIALYRRLLFTTFDPDVAGVSGVNVAAMEAVLMVLLSATILVTVRVVGVLLISAMLVLPAVTARLLTDSFGRMLVLSPILGAGIGVAGMYASWYADVPSGAVIILVGTAVFLAVYVSVGVRNRARVGNLDHHGAAIKAA
ncbi:MAG: metal ABC transporter permease [Actinomycetota bacterium]|jgi:manganese/iron transport system permease protein/iron/zinc/copper transport system permease protein